MSETPSNYRNVCKHNEAYMQPILSNIYRLLDINFERVYDKDRQVLGGDIAFINANETMYLDEKVRMHSQLYVPKGDNAMEKIKESQDTFNMELSYRNRCNEITKGWFHPKEREKAINQGYVFTWVNSVKEKDNPRKAGEFRKINQLEICVVPYDKLREVVEKALDGMTVDEKVSEIYDDIHKNGYEDMHRVYHSALSDQRVRFSYGGDKPGQSLSCIIPKNLLREMSFLNYAFEMKGQLSHERPIAFKNLKHDPVFAPFRPMSELSRDVKEHPVSFPRPIYVSLDEKKDRIIHSIGAPAKAFSILVPYNYITQTAPDFIKYTKDKDHALQQLVASFADATQMVTSQYYPVVMGMSPEKCDKLTTEEKRDLMVNAILKDNDKLCEIYTIQALENLGHDQTMILRATNKELPTSLVDLSRRIKSSVSYIQFLEETELKKKKPKDIEVKKVVDVEVGEKIREDSQAPSLNDNEKREQEPVMNGRGMGEMTGNSKEFHSHSNKSPSFDHNKVESKDALFANEGLDVDKEFYHTSEYTDKNNSYHVPLISHNQSSIEYINKNKTKHETVVEQRREEFREEVYGKKMGKKQKKYNHKPSRSSHFPNRD